MTSHDLSLKGAFENGGRNLKTIKFQIGNVFKFRGGGDLGWGNLETLWCLHTRAPVHSYDTVHTVAGPSVKLKGIIGMHRFNICLAGVFLWCENTITPGQMCRYTGNRNINIGNNQGLIARDSKAQRQVIITN